MADFLPYGRQTLDDEDIAAVVAVLKSAWLTTGPAVEQFESALCAFTTAKYGVAMANGTAALHAAMHALGIKAGDEVIVPPLTFAATANSVLYCGGTPVFADVDPQTLLLDPAAAAAAITPRTRAIVGVDYAGQPCDWQALRALADRHGLALVADSCHAIGASDQGKPVGTLADITVFSFHPVKPMTTAEGGACMTDDPALAEKMRIFRNHGITTTAAQREKAGGWFYEMTELGYNYRITDLQCALGVSQLKKLPQWMEKRNRLAGLYDNAFEGSGIQPLASRAGTTHARHLYVVQLQERDRVFKQLRAAGIGANVHYVPVHLHPYYRETLGTKEGLCPVAEEAYGQILTLPLWVGMDEKDVLRVVEELKP